MNTTNTNSRASTIAIGGLSERTGVNIETIRYYERIGLLPSPQRSSGGHRVYDDPLVKRLQFVRRSRELGLSIEEIRALLRLIDQGGLACADAKTITETHLADVRGKIADLSKLEDALARMAKACETNQLPLCPVLDALSQPV